MAAKLKTGEWVRVTSRARHPNEADRVQDGRIGRVHSSGSGWIEVKLLYEGPTTPLLVWQTIHTNRLDRTEPTEDEVYRWSLAELNE